MKEALRAYTYGAAFAAFEEKVKEHATYKNFIEVMLDNARKKK